MSKLATGDTTTQLVLYLQTNCEGGEKTKRAKTQLAVDTGLSAAKDLQVLLVTYIGR